jgi:hypothetical protein
VQKDLVFGAGDFLFRRAYDGVGFVILIAIVSRLIPQLVAVLEFGFGLGHVNLVGV